VIAPARLKQALRVIRPDILILLGESAGSRSATERAAEALGGIIRAL
jgi:hypothetical protein